MANVSTPSAAYEAMRPLWEMISDILAGPEAIRAKGEKYLPAYKSETEEPNRTEYKRRLASTPWRPEFEDAIRTLAAKPFSKDVSLTEGASQRLRELSEDIDGRGNNLSVFARSVFEEALAFGCHAILVDNSGSGGARTQAEERAQGVRPYWVSIRADKIISLRTAFIGGREVITEARIRADEVEGDGYAEKVVEKVRVYMPGAWQLWKKIDGTPDAEAWVMESEGPMAPLTEVPLALIWTGRRKGSQQVRPPLGSLADMQMEIYRALSRKDEVYTYAGSPMLVGEGISPPGPDSPPVLIGPKRILFAPSRESGTNPTYKYIQPDAAVLTEIREDVDKLIDDFRRLAMQPLTTRSGGITATAAAIEGAKAHSAVEAWALALKDTLEQALVFTAQWLGEQTEAEVVINTDFGVEAYAQAPLDALAKAREAREISREAYIEGLKRFDVLPPDFDGEADLTRITEELPGDPTEEDERAALGAQAA